MGSVHPSSVVAIKLDQGDMVPADCIFIEGFNLEMDQSNLTGESKGVYKSSRDPFIFARTQVIDGLGTAIVTAVGVNTVWGATCKYKLLFI